MRSIINLSTYTFLVVVTFLFSVPVDLDVANKVSDNFIRSIVKDSRQDVSVIFDQKISSSNDIDLIYIYKVYPYGFVLISADNQVQPILAYSIDNNFKYDYEATNISYIINLYKKKILENISDAVDEVIHSEWSYFLNENSELNKSNNRRSVEPLISARFDQGCSWNSMCPEDPSGPCGNTWVGCGAVAMAQILHYWKYPLVGNGSNSYYHDSYGLISANFGNTMYDYENMPNNSASEESQLLLLHAGVAIEMEYGPSVSWSYMWSGAPSVIHALPNYFMYSEDIGLIHDYQYSQNAFMNILKHELDNHRPIFYRGQDPEDGGHFWNIDGYQDDYFHCNWGWGGYGNGYYSLSSLNPGNGDYTDNQSALINIVPMDISEPRLIYDDYQINEIGGEIDYVINPNDTVEVIISYSLNTSFNNADDIELNLYTDASNITFLNSNYSHGELVAGSSFSNISDPFVFYVNSNSNFGDITLIVEATTQADGNIYEQEVVTLGLNISNNQSGFPIVSNSQYKGSPIVLDLDYDEVNEIIVGDYFGVVNSYAADGSELEIADFPYDTGDQIWASIASADLDLDGSPDIVVSSKSKYIYIFNQDGLQEEYYTDKFLVATPAIGQLDNDSALEIVVGSYSSNGNKIFAINSDGTPVEGFPVDVDGKIFKGVALYDFNGNGFDDIIFGDNEDNIHLMLDDGSISWSYTTDGKILSAPSIINVNQEILICTGSDDYNLYCIDDEGNLKFSYLTGGKIRTSPMLLEIDNQIAIFFGSNDGYIYAVNLEGQDLVGWPQITNGDIIESIVFSDIDSDNSPDIIAVNDVGELLCYDIDGTLKNNFPIQSEFSFTSAPHVQDLDNDGDLEIVVGTSNSIEAFDIKTTGSSYLYGNTYKGSELRSSYYEFLDEVLSGDINQDYNVNILDVIFLVGFILGNTSPTDLEFQLADINDDSIIDILDIVQLVMNILSS